MASDPSPERNAVATQADTVRHTKRKMCDLDLDTLGCPLCNLLLSPPVLQCYNGHTMCQSCYEQLTEKQCPSCSLPIGDYRCNIVEKIIESLEVQCKHAGCNEMLHNTKSDEHEEMCEYRLFHCPLAGCGYEGLMGGITQHFQARHGARACPMDQHGDKEQCFLYVNPDFSGGVRYIVVQSSNGSGAFLLQHGFDEEFYRYNIFWTSFGARNRFYRLSVKVKQGTTHCYSIEAPVSDNQFDTDWLAKMESRSDFLTVSPLPKNITLYEESRFEVRIELL
ncbi:hypothetical protein M758_10G023300 [Ceratodon purpureus]|nr:hypothetical protein M758_10G023300 [Ceratodon purpureus]